MGTDFYLYLTICPTLEERRILTWAELHRQRSIGVSGPGMTWRIKTFRDFVVHGGPHLSRERLPAHGLPHAGPTEPKISMR
ncbi:uncharacterized protein N7500_010856 [Penicillium coprophilum]|uniref:uncharacterized protein n=1 Tax=Penicillium coprophilum TaxID=36646 RepID=UPI0023A24193|nr:uncharacterized protein N7500_010856 [Penicillium coprophilum]KAJ5150667.1 hypothetical protein N7500_010856 [Penicillium coprophilum]